MLLVGVFGVIALEDTPKGELEALDGVDDGGGGITFSFERRVGRMPGGGVRDDLQVLFAVKFWESDDPGGFNGDGV